MTDRKLIIDTPFWKDLYAGEDPAFDPERASDLFAQIPEFARLANFTAEELEKLSVELEKIAADPEQFRFWDLYRRTIMQEGTAGGDPAAMKQAGIAYATDQIIDLYANGIKNVHVYSMNKPDVAAKIQNNLSDILGK